MKGQQMQENMSSMNAEDPYFAEQKKAATGVTDGSSGWRKRQIAEWIAQNEGSFLPPLPLTKSQYGFDDTPAFTANQMREYAIEALRTIAGKVKHGQD